MDIARANAIGEFVRDHILQKFLTHDPIEDLRLIHPESGGSLINALLYASSASSSGYNPLPYWIACFTTQLFSYNSYEAIENIKTTINKKYFTGV